MATSENEESKYGGAASDLLTSLKGFVQESNHLGGNTDGFRYVDSSEFSDLTIQTTDREFKVHKVVVCGQSAVFNAMFRGESKVSLSDFNIFMTTQI